MVPVHKTALEVYAGDAWSQAFVFKTGDTPDDLTAWTGWACQWRKAARSATAIDLTVDASDAANGVIVVSATGEQTREMGAGGVFDVEAVQDSTPRTFIRGSTSWVLDVTRD